MSLGSASFQNLFGFLRILLVFVLIVIFCIIYGAMFNNVVPANIAADYRSTNPIFKNSPDWLLVPFAAVINPYSWRYFLAPLMAMLMVILAGGYYVKDVYALPSYRSALQYVLASMFAVLYPSLTIDGGKKQIKPNEINLIDLIGGPGAVQVEPGSAAIFRHLRGHSITVVGSTYFAEPFETVAHTIDLNEQQGDKDNITAMTRDGILVTLSDVHFRYRICHRMDKHGRTVQSTTNDPYPFPPDALSNTINNLSVQADGLDKWNVAVERALTGAITDFIAANTIDYLTAPCIAGNAPPRPRMRNELFLPVIRNSLERLGAELIWADIGHMEINLDTVDEQRITVWAAPWMGGASVTKAYGEALRQAYRELGRAQAQAEIIMAITDALNNANLADNPPENLRTILMARTAQVLDSISSRDNGDLRTW